MAPFPLVVPDPPPNVQSQMAVSRARRAGIRSVMITGQHTPLTRMFDNTNFAWIEDMRADAETLPTIGHLLRDLGYYTVYKGKWHLSEFPAEGTRDAMEPYGFSEYQEWGDAQGGPLDGALKDPKIADEAVDWLTKEKKFKAAVMIVANDEAGRNSAKSFRDRFGAGGGKVLAEEQIALDGNDFRAQLRGDSLVVWMDLARSGNAAWLESNIDLDSYYGYHAAVQMAARTSTEIPKSRRRRRISAPCCAPKSIR